MFFAAYTKGLETVLSCFLHMGSIPTFPNGGITACYRPPSLLPVDLRRCHEDAVYKLGTVTSPRHLGPIWLIDRLCNLDVATAAVGF